MYFLKGRTTDRLPMFVPQSLGNFYSCELGFIEIIEVATGHWVVITSDYLKVHSQEKSPQDKIVIFDPHYLSFYNHKEKRVSYPLNLLKKVDSFINYPGSTIKIKAMNIPQASIVFHI